MALDFPNSPTTGQVFQNWQWDGAKWTQALAQASGSPILNTQIFTASGTYVPTVGAVAAMIECVGGGGGGAASSTPGNPGTATTFGSFLTASGGGGGVAPAGTSNGGTASGGDVNIPGSSGLSSVPPTSTSGAVSGAGGASFFGGTGPGGWGGSWAAVAAPANTGCGGASAASNAAASAYSSSGGGAGGYCRKLLTAAQIGASQPIVIGAGGAGLAAAGNWTASAAGGSGLCIITEYASIQGPQGVPGAQGPAGLAGSAVIPGGGLLSYVSTTALKFAPWRGNQIKINGAYYTIPNAGIAGLANTNIFVNGVASQTPTAGQSYFVYAFSNGGVITADFSTTGHATSTTAGNEGTEIKSGDDTRSLIGYVRFSATGTFLDNPQHRLVRSWFNKHDVDTSFTNSFTAQRSTSSTSAAEINAEIRCEMLTWSAEMVTAALLGYAYNSTTQYIQYAIGWDGVITDANHWALNFGSTGGPLAATESKGLAEGYHYLTMMGMVSAASTGNYGTPSNFNSLNGRIG